MLNKVMLIGHLGRDPDARVGDKPLTFSLATSKRWKGSKVYVEGAMETREYQARDGGKRYVTEVVLQGFAGKLVMLDRREGAPSASRDDAYGAEPEYEFGA